MTIRKLIWLLIKQGRRHGFKHNVKIDCFDLYYSIKSVNHVRVWNRDKKPEGYYEFVSISNKEFR